MENVVKKGQQRFYVLSVDLIQAIFLFWFVSGHTCLWWDHTIETRYPDVPLVVFLFITFALIVPPGFLFLYSFNTVNSLLRKKSIEERKESRSRLLRRGLIFFFIAELAEVSTALITSPNYLLNSFFTWELFHQFAFSTLFILLLFEIAWLIERYNNWSYQKICIAEFIVCFSIILAIYLVFHDYTQTKKIEGLFVNLELKSILERALFESGQAPIIPFLLFSLQGGFLALFLDLPNEQRRTTNIKAKFVIISGIVLFIIGILSLSIEKYVSPVMYYPASSPVVFISLGVIPLGVILLIYLLDINSLYSRRSIHKLLAPFVLVSKITLTVYIVHNLAYIIPPDTKIVQFLITDIHIALGVGVIYSIFFIFIAYLWQKWSFRYSIEWVIWKLQNSK
ncbi:MAG: hypothetical protein ACFFAU_11460 [Candidatus Hodarchaeota archaeon]